MTRAAAILLLVAAMPAWGDVVLDGAQHIGDSDSATLQPGDPVTRRQHNQSPTNFHLSSALFVTAVQLNGLAGTVDASKLRVRINGNLITATFSGDTFTLSPVVYPLGLPLPGNRVHTIAIDPGCSGTTPGINSECASNTGNDIGFSAITLKSTGTTTSTNLARRRHLGRNSSETNNYGGNFYPDAPDCAQPLPAVCSVTISFTLSVPQRLTQLRIYRLRNIDTRAGAVDGQVLLDGTLIGTLAQNQDPYRINTNTVLFAGTHTLTLSAGLDRNGAVDDISFDDINLLYTFDSSLLPGAFNAVDTGANGVNGRLQTKVAGAPFAVDLIALNATRDGVQPGYAGTVRVELLDATDNGGPLDTITSCRASWTLAQDLGLVTFVTVDGRQPMTGIVYNNALRSARFRLTQTDGSIRGCSTDAFTLRPNHFNLAVSGGPSSAVSYTASSTPVHQAGRPFTVVATAAMASGTATNYDGQPTLVASSSLLGLNVGVVSADNWSVSAGVAESSNVRYSEAGAVVLRATDTQFAAIDVDDTPLTDRTVAGEINAGRFIPDHFAFTPVQAELTAGCVNFTYAGQILAFTMGAAPVGRITAEAFGGATTTNYDSDSGLYKLPANLPQSTYTLYDDPAIPGTPQVDMSTVPADDNDVVEIGDGIAEVRLTVTNFALLRPATPGLPYSAEMQIDLGALGEPDGVVFDAGTPGRFGEAAPDNGIPFLGGATAKQVRFGRLVVDSAHGSELLPLDVPLRTEYWASLSGSTGFVQSLGDGCTFNTTPPQPSQIVLDKTPSGLGTSVTSVSAVGTGGVGRITLQAPGAAGFATVSPDLSAVLLPHLRGDWDGNGTWADPNDDPSGRASFGLHKNETRRIYQREVIGN